LVCTEEASVSKRDQLTKKTRRAGEALRKADAECDAYDNLPSTLDTKAPELPSLRQVVDTTYKNASVQLKREIQEEIERDYYEEHKVEVISAQILAQLASEIDKAAETGKDRVSYESKTSFHSLSGATRRIEVTAAEGIAVAKALKQALKDFNPNVHFVEPDPVRVSNWQRILASNHYDYADGGLEYHSFRGWRVELDWHDHVQKKLHG
jgi:hypothetical protein